MWSKGDGVGLHLVAWEMVSPPKLLGGLGVCQFRYTNIALLGKLIWEFCDDSSKIWVRLLREKY